MAFMNPEYVNGEFSLVETNGESIWTPSEYVESGDTVSEKAIGWFVRLSASGYLDATEWSGPFKSRLDAEMALEANDNVCHECGESMPDDDSTQCEACETDFL